VMKVFSSCESCLVLSKGLWRQHDTEVRKS
jgi:hypothetical protein